MKISRWILTFLSAALFIPRLLCAGTLDDAPFRVELPDAGWQIDDSKAMPLGEGVFLAATISNNTNTQLKGVIIKAFLTTQDASLNGICAGIRQSFLDQGFKITSDADTTFLGYHARTFTYFATRGGQTFYNQATTFIADGKNWTIDCVGPSEQKDEVQKIAGFYIKK